MGEAESPGGGRGYRQRIAALTLPDEVREKLLSEVDRLSRLNPSSHEGGVIRGYLDTCLDLPWGSPPGSLNITTARHTFDADHYGLERLKNAF